MTARARPPSVLTILLAGAFATGACSVGPAAPARPAPEAPTAGVTDLLGDDDEEFDRTELLVRLAAGASISTVNARYGTTTIESLSGLRVHLLRVPAGRTLEDLLAEMARDPDVAGAGPNRRLESPEADGGSTMAFADPSLEPPDYRDQDVLDRIRVPEAWRRSRGAGVLVAVLDTGVQAGHPLLAGRVASGGWDFVDADGDPADAPDGADSDGDGLVDEALGHGTFAAGLVLAVAPEARVLPVRVLDSDGVGTAFAVAQGIERALARGARVVNMSFGMSAGDPVVEELLEEAAEESDVVFVASGGNRNVSFPSQFPAREEDVTGVAATDGRDGKAPFSNYGTWLGVAAPGVGLVAPWTGGGLATWSGTSFAAALTSGEAALLVSAGPGASAHRVASAIRLGAVPLTDPALHGIGRIDAAAALDRILASGGVVGGGDGEEDGEADVDD